MLFRTTGRPVVDTPKAQFSIQGKHASALFSKSSGARVFPDVTTETPERADRHEWLLEPGQYWLLEQASSVTRIDSIVVSQDLQISRIAQNELGELPTALFFEIVYYRLNAQ